MVLKISVTYEAQMQELPALSFMEDHRTRFTHKEATNGNEGWLEVAKAGEWSGFERRYCFLQVDPVPCFKYYESATSTTALETKAFAHHLTTKTILAKDIVTMSSHHDRRDHATKRKNVNFQISHNEAVESGNLVEMKIGQLVGSVVQATGLRALSTGSAGVRLLTEVKYGQQEESHASSQLSPPETMSRNAEHNFPEGLAHETASSVLEDDMVPLEPDDAWYMATKKATIRVGSACDSGGCGKLKRYERVRVTHTKMVGETLRLRTLRGWVNAKSSSGLSTTMLSENNDNKFFRCKRNVTIEQDVTIKSPAVGQLEKNDVIESLESTVHANTGTVRHRVSTGWISETDFDLKSTPDPYCVVEVTGAGDHKTETVDDNLSPEWQSPFAFRVVSSSVKVKVSVWDDNSVKHDGHGVPIGVAELVLGADGIPGPMLSGVGVQPWTKPEKEDQYVHGREGEKYDKPSATVGKVNTKTRQQLWEEKQAEIAAAGMQTQALSSNAKCISVQLYAPVSAEPCTGKQKTPVVVEANHQGAQVGTLVLRVGYSEMFDMEYLAKKQAENGGNLVEAMMEPDTVETTIRFRAMSEAIQRSWLGAVHWLATGCDPSNRPDDTPVPPLLSTELRRASNDISLLDLPFSRVPMLLKGLYMRKTMGAHKPTLRRLIYTVFNLELHASSGSVQHDHVSRKIAHRMRASDPSGIYLQELRGLNFHMALERLALLHYGKSHCLSYQQQMEEYEKELHSASLQVMSAVISMWVFRRRFGKTIGGKPFPFHLAWQRFPHIYNLALEGLCASRLRSLNVLLGEIRRYSKPTLADVILPKRARGPRKGSTSPRNGGADSPRKDDDTSRCFRRKAKEASLVDGKPAATTTAEEAPAMDEAQRRARFEEIFRAIDIDGGGTLDRDEVNAALEMLTGAKQSQAELTSFMHLVDEDGNGEVDLEEFVSGMEHIGKETDEQFEDHSDDDDSDLDDLGQGVEELSASLATFD
jgi:hypothetical protein